MDRTVFDQRKSFMGSKTVKRTLPINLNLADLGLFKHELEKVLPFSWARRIKNGRILGDTALSICNLRLFEKESHVQPLSMKGRLVRLKKLWEKPLYFESGAWIIDNWSNGYFHWITDALPRFLVAEKLLKGVPALLPDSYKPALFTERILAVETIA